MKPISLYDRTYAFNGVYIMLMTNRLQMLYFFIILPMYLIHPYMIWGIIGVGILSQVNLILLSKWFQSEYSKKGYQGFIELIGKRMVRFFSFLGLFFILLKLIVIVLGYAEIVEQFIFPSMNSKWLILTILLVCFYVASLGMEKTIGFAVIAFFCTAWIILLFYIFFLPPNASVYDLYPLIPFDWPDGSWKSLLLIWSSLSGPEYLICLATWLKPNQNFLKYLSFANAMTILEYLLLFIASLLFFGADYLSFSKFPIVHLARYLQFPFIERIDIILISILLFNAIFAGSLFLLYFYGGLKIAAAKLNQQSSRVGFYACFIIIFICLYLSDEWLSQFGMEQSVLLNIQIWSGALTYLLVPSFLFSAMKRKGREKT